MGATARSAASHVFACVRADSRRQRCRLQRSVARRTRLRLQYTPGTRMLTYYRMPLPSRYPRKRSAAAGALVKPYA